VKIVLAALLLILLLLQVRLWSGAGSLADINRLEGEIQVQQADNVLLIERNEVLREEVNDLKNGLDSIEERARSQLGLVRKGETFILVVDQPEGTGAGGTGRVAIMPGAASGAAAEPGLPVVATDSVIGSGLDTLPPPVASDERPVLPPVIDPAP
jgi:cell division protein FtsB